MSEQQPRAGYTKDSELVREIVMAFEMEDCSSPTSTIADSVAEILNADRREWTAPEPRRSPSEPPEQWTEVWVRFVTAGNAHVTAGYVAALGRWVEARHGGGFSEVTGWQPIVRPIP